MCLCADGPGMTTSDGMIGYCRICAQKNEELISVYSDRGICLQLYRKLKVCLQMTVLQNDNLPTAICLQCLTKLEACYQLFELRIKGEDTLRSYQGDLIDLSNKRNNYQGVMHGDNKGLMPVKMEEDIFDHPKRRKMRRHMQGGANAAAQNVRQPPQQENQPSSCACETCTQAQFGGLPLLAHVSSQQQPEHTIVNLDNPPRDIHYTRMESDSNSYRASDSGSSSYQTVESVTYTYLGPENTATNLVRAESIPRYVGEQSSSSNYIAGQHDSSNYVEAQGGVPTFFEIQPSQIPSFSDTNVEQEFAQRTTQSNLSSPRASPPKEDSSGSATSPRKEIPCDFCGKTFTHTGDLNKHRRIHTGERPYKCTQCDRKFSHASNLLRHRKIHSGERPFTCSQCGKGFSRKDKMLNHKKSATCTKRSDSLHPSPGSSGSH